MDTERLGIFRVWTNVTNPPTFWGVELPLTPSAAAARAAFDPIADEPTANCAPKGMPFIMEQPYPIQFVERDNGDILLRMEEYDTVRIIEMSGAAPSDGDASLLGDSHGQWNEETKTLIVTTTNIGYPWLNGTGVPLGPDASIEERFTLNGDGSRLYYTMAVTAPASLTSPVTFRKSWEWRPGEQVRPYECLR